MQMFYCFYLDTLHDPFFKKFLLLFYSPSTIDSNCIIVDKYKLEKDFLLYQQCSIFLTLTKKKIAYKKIDILTQHNFIREHERKLEDYYEPSYDPSSEFEMMTFFNQALSKKEASLAIDIYINKKKLSEIAQELNVTPQAITKKEKKTS